MHLCQLFHCALYTTDPLTLAITHHTNKLKWNTFHHWQRFVIKSKLKRLQIDLTQFIYRRKLCQRMFTTWQRHVSQSIEVQRSCIDYKRTGRRNGPDENIMNLIVAIHHRQQYLRRKYFNRWRSTILHHVTIDNKQ